MGDNKKLLDARNVVMNFGGLKALDGVDVHVNENEILGLIGPNGSGKTTFFNVITGLYHLTDGEVFFEGMDITDKTPQEIARLGIIRTFQSSRLWFELSVLDNVILGMYMREKPSLISSFFQYNRVRSDLESKAEEAKSLLNEFNPELADNCYKRAQELALVDRRRVEICRALVAHPKLLLLDEPSAGMDPAETKELMDDIKRVRETRIGLGIIIIEHDMTVISTVAERVVVFNFGKKIAEGDFSQIRLNKEVREAYLGKD